MHSDIWTNKNNRKTLESIFTEDIETSLFEVCASDNSHTEEIEEIIRFFFYNDRNLVTKNLEKDKGVVGMSENKMDDEFTRLMGYYEKAIEGRNFHYQNYNTWVNYFSIFTGALFVAYYTIMEKNNCNFFSFIVLILGIVTSICWNKSIKGHYHWMLSWIKVVQDYEKKLAKLSNKNKQLSYYVYSVYKGEPCDFFQKNISTQRLMVKFTFIVIVAWILLLLKKIYDYFDLNLNNFFCFFKCECFKFFCIFAVIFGICIVLILFFDWKEESDVTKMPTSICGK